MLLLYFSIRKSSSLTIHCDVLHYGDNGRNVNTRNESISMFCIYRINDYLGESHLLMECRHCCQTNCHEQVMICPIQTFALSNSSMNNRNGYKAKNSATQWRLWLPLIGIHFRFTSSLMFGFAKVSPNASCP